jgi:GxxExxY protein
VRNLGPQVIGARLPRIDLQEGDAHIEFDAHDISYESEEAVTVGYRGVQIQGQRIDLVVRGLIVVELKAVARFDDVHQAQVMSYLRTTGLRGGLLINFRVPRPEGRPQANCIVIDILRDLRALRG